MAHKWARWLHHPFRLGDPHRFRAGGKIRSGPQVGKVAASPLPPRGSPPLQSGGQNQKWPTSGQGGCITPAAWGNPTASERGAGKKNVQKSASPLHYGGSLAKRTKSKVAELGARTTLWMSSPEEYHQKNFRTNDVSASKNTLKTPLQTILKGGGGFKTPHRYRISQKPPPPD